MLPLADPQRFVGRHRQLVALSEALEARSRLVTLHGPSGVGKSRLAAEHLKAVANDRRTIAVHLEDARSLSDALALMASALEAPAAAGPDPAHVLADRLRELGPLTLVLDHIDGVSAELAGPISRWLETCPETHFVATCHRPLSLADEHPCAVEPLSLPISKSDRVPSDALRLWHLLRGSEARRDRPVDAELVDLLRALSGLPLLIELIAALAERLTPFALLERLSPRLGGLGLSPSADAVLRAVLDTVWSGMGDAERRAFAACAVFGTSFDREAYATVLDAARSPRNQLDADQAISALIGRRLLSRLHTTDGSERYGVHPALRLAARDQLDELGASAQAELAHARYFVKKGGELAEALEGRDGPEATRALVREQGNLLTIVSRAPRAGDADDLALRLKALCVHDHVLSTFGPVDSDLARLDHALSATEQLRVPDTLLTEGLCVRAFVLARTGAFERAFADLERAQALANDVAMRGSYPAGRVAVTVAFVCLSAGRIDEAEAQAKLALTIAESVDHVRLQGIALGVFALVRRVRGFDDEARVLYEQALEHHRSVHNRRFEGIVMTRLAQLKLDAGEPEAALALADEARELHRTFADHLMEGLCLEVQAVVDHGRGQLESARKALETARPQLAAAGGAALTAGILALLGRVRAELGDYDLARRELAGAQREYAARGALREDVLCRARVAGLEALLLADSGAAQASFASIEPVDDDPWLFALLDVERAQLDLLELRVALARADTGAASEARRRAQARRARLFELTGDVPQTNFRSLADARASLRILDTLLKAHDHGPSARSLSLSLATRSLVAPSGETIDMSSRPALRRILTRLAVHNLRAPGEALRALELFSAGWPGEHPGEENARLQVYAVLGTLRKLGLGDALISDDRGHHLASDVSVRFV
jgi:tetratricopeptide (TPR) repeat protein